MNPWHDIEPSRITPENFIAIIEIPKGSKKKYELDKSTGLIKLDRILFTSTHYPSNYGFIPRTLADDNDPLDVLVLCSEVLDPLTMVECYPIGVVKMVDNNEVDEKIISVPFRDPVYSGYRDISTLPQHIIQEISHFFEVYKALEHSDTSVKMNMDRDKALRIIEHCQNIYNEAFPAKSKERDDGNTTPDESPPASRARKSRSKAGTKTK
jgi:inorganic pyrophosphatase